MPLHRETAEASSPSNGADNSKLDHHSQLNSSPITLKFFDVTYRLKLDETSTRSRTSTLLNTLFSTSPSSSDVESPIQQRSILNNITGMATPGRILAILGPSGSGKSTLLNALAGRLHTNLTGTILYNTSKFKKPISKKTGFVAQDDILYPHLTVRETLIFCCLLRLPNTIPQAEKIARADSVITELGLTKCQDTIIGNSFIRGVSGGERKRVSIGHEMVMDPSLLILDEPTSGLDATAAYRLVATLNGLAAKGKTVVTSIHQPSSRVYRMFDDVLVLSEGRCIYFGKGGEAMGYLESVGFAPSFAMNPADFLLDLANDEIRVQSTMHASLLYINEAITEITEFDAKKLDSGESVSTTTMISNEMRVLSDADWLNKERIKTPKWIDQCTTGGSYILLLKFEDLDPLADWFYNACSKCTSGVKDRNVGDPCIGNKCKGQPIEKIVPRLKVIVDAISPLEESIKLVLFESIIIQLTGLDTSALIVAATEAGDVRFAPDELTQILDKDYLCQIQVNKGYNVARGKKDFTVESITDSKELIDKFLELTNGLGRVIKEEDSNKVTDKVENDEDSTLSNGKTPGKRRLRYGSEDEEGNVDTKFDESSTKTQKTKII